MMNIDHSLADCAEGGCFHTDFRTGASLLCSFGVLQELDELPGQ